MIVHNDDPLDCVIRENTSQAFDNGFGFIAGSDDNGSVPPDTSVQDSGQSDQLSYPDGPVGTPDGPRDDATGDAPPVCPSCAPLSEIEPSVPWESR